VGEKGGRTMERRSLVADMRHSATLKQRKDKGRTEEKKKCLDGKQGGVISQENPRTTLLLKC